MRNQNPIFLVQLHNPTDTLTNELVVADIELGSPEKERYTIVLPSVRENDLIYEIPEVEFLKKKGFGILGP